MYVLRLIKSWRRKPKFNFRNVSRKARYANSEFTGNSLMPMKNVKMITSVVRVDCGVEWSQTGSDR